MEWNPTNLPWLVELDLIKAYYDHLYYYQQGDIS